MLDDIEHVVGFRLLVFEHLDRKADGRHRHAGFVKNTDPFLRLARSHNRLDPGLKFEVIVVVPVSTIQPLVFQRQCVEESLLQCSAGTGNRHGTVRGVIGPEVDHPERQDPRRRNRIQLFLVGRAGHSQFIEMFDPLLVALPVVILGTCQLVVGQGHGRLHQRHVDDTALAGPLAPKQGRSDAVRQRHGCHVV